MWVEGTLGEWIAVVPPEAGCGPPARVVGCLMAGEVREHSVGFEGVMMYTHVVSDVFDDAGVAGAILNLIGQLSVATLVENLESSHDD